MDKVSETGVDAVSQSTLPSTTVAVQSSEQQNISDDVRQIEQAWDVQRKNLCLTMYIPSDDCHSKITSTLAAFFWQTWVRVVSLKFSSYHLFRKENILIILDILNILDKWHERCHKEVLM